MARLTDKTLAQSTAITPTTLIHIVYTGDPSQNPAGSSYKAELQQLGSIFAGLTFTGGTVNGSTDFTNGVTTNSISATTYENLPVSGLTEGTNIGLVNNNGNYTISVTGVTSGGSFSGGTVTGATSFTNGLTANTISATTYQNLPVSGLTAGGNINISGSNGNFTISVTGVTTPNLQQVTTIGNTTTNPIYVQAGTTNSEINSQYVKSQNTFTSTYANLLGAGELNLKAGTRESTLRNLNVTNTGVILEFPNKTTGSYTIATTNDIPDVTNYLALSGGTITGATSFTNGLSANTISATTYQNLPVSGLTAGTNIGLTNNDGNYTISVTGITGGSSINPFNDIGSTTSPIVWNVSGVSTNYEATLTAITTTLNLTNVRNGDYGTIILKQDGVGSRAISLGTVNGGAGTHRVANNNLGVLLLTSNANAIDIATFTYNGSVMYWTVANDFS